jgi:hypothetical protein
VRCGDRAAKIATRDNRICRDQKEPERIAEIPAHNGLSEPDWKLPGSEGLVVEIVPRHSHPRKLEHHRYAKMARLGAPPPPGTGFLWAETGGPKSPWRPN